MIEHLRNYYRYNKDTGEFTRRIPRGDSNRAGCIYSDATGRAYATIMIKGKTYPLQNIIYAFVTGALPDSKLIFKDGDGSNFRWDNLALKKEVVGYRPNVATDRAGHRYGALTVLTSFQHNGKTHWNCRCDCGNEISVVARKLTNMTTCGCNIPGVNVKHDLSFDPLYRIWAGMKTRCYRKSNPAYHSYGGRGIKICDRWLEFLNFYNDMHPTYVEGLSIDRIDVNGDYSPENCRWATQKEQANNQRKNIRIELNGKNQTVAQWCDELGIPRHRVYSRLKLGWTPEDALFKAPTQ